jgi:hypothetical protein
MRLARFVIGLRERRGSVAVFAAFAMAALLGSAALAVDVGFLYRQEMRLQLAADAGALGAARLLPGHTSTTSAYQAAALSEVNDVAAGAVAGTVQTPVGASYAPTWSTVTITLTSTPSSFFARAVGFVPSTITASATASATVVPPTACVLATSKTASPAIQVDNSGSIVATGSAAVNGSTVTTGCPIFSDSSAGTSIYLNTGTIEGSSIAAVGNVVKSNSGSNTMEAFSIVNGQTVPPLTATSGTSNAASESDPFSLLTVPSYGSCNYTNLNANVNSVGTYHFTQAANVFCGNTSIGGNATTDTFAPGTYYVVNGNLTFNNASVTSASGVTFVLTGSSPGSFQWTNYSNTTTTMTAPTSGTLAGILVWQTCNSSGSDSANTFQGGSTLAITGAIYTPCGQVNMSNNVKLTGASVGSFSVVAQTMYVTGSASLSMNPSTTQSSATTTYTLLQ